MITDDDRVRIVRKLRKLDPTDKSWYSVYGGFDWALFADEFFEAIELPREKDNWCEYLADIIESNCRFYTEYLAELIVSR